MKEKWVVASWSGGIDSTAVIANLLRRGWQVEAVTLRIYGGEFGRREAKAREILGSTLDRIAKENGGGLLFTTKDAKWIWAFSPDGVEIPRRNKHIMDHLITTEMMPRGITNLAMGEYVGADTWLVRDHVAAADGDHRSLSAYLYHEYGVDYRLLSLQDFGESRYKSDRMKLGWDVIGPAMLFTSNCLTDGPIHCGECYKCLERRAALMTLGLADLTEYATDPTEKSEMLGKYLRQMTGEEVTLPWAEAKASDRAMPAAEL